MSATTVGGSARFNEYFSDSFILYYYIHNNNNNNTTCVYTSFDSPEGFIGGAPL